MFAPALYLCANKPPSFASANVETLADTKPRRASINHIGYIGHILKLMDFFLDILKLTLPAVIVGGTAYLLLKALLDERQRMDAALLRNDAHKITLPLRLGAYERLMLLCDRADIANTILRVRMPNMKVRELRGVLLMAINQEFEHNVSQQLYVSDTLWQIIRMAKNNTLALVTMTAPDLDPDADAEAFADVLLKSLDEQSITPLQTAILAVRMEAGKLF